ncbi:MAG: DUF3817 domain-containing protein [Mycobacteriales bacterium]
MTDGSRAAVLDLVSPSTAMTWFRIAAIAEACSWVGLLAGMFFKYVVVGNEIGVKIFGPVHGGLFLAYLVAVTLAALRNGWNRKRLIYGLLASIPPLFTLWFERTVARSQPPLPRT